jgi:hypothetical protein
MQMPLEGLTVVAAPRASAPAPGSDAETCKIEGGTMHVVLTCWWWEDISKMNEKSKYSIKL